MQYININGQVAPANNAAVAMDNGAFRYGYGLFETMLVQDGRIILQEYHMERLHTGLQQLQLQLPPHTNIGTLAASILETVRKNQLQKLCRVRLQVYAGGGGLYGQDVAKAGYIIECFLLNEEAARYNVNGLQVGIAAGISKSNDALANLKTCNALAYAMAARQAKEHKWNDALVRNAAGNIIESTIANIFWVKDNTIYTPPLSEGCIAGVMRKYLMTEVAVIEQPLTEDILMEADEVFLTNAIKRIKWIATIGDRHYTNTTSRRMAHQLFNSVL